MKTSQLNAIWYAARDKEIERRLNTIKANNLSNEFNEFVRTKKISFNRALGLFMKKHNLTYIAIR